MEFTTLGLTSSQWVFIVGNSCNNQLALDLKVEISPSGDFKSFLKSFFSCQISKNKI
jgi:hypothetical protein